MIEIKTYKGHIRNWRPLITELNITGSLSREEREHAIIIKAYETWGAEMVNHFYGMFAIALYDTEKDRLFACRDHFGTESFYYYITAAGELLYGTMIRDILDKKDCVKEMNEEMLQIYLSLTYAAGEDTFFKGIKKLLPGRYLIFEKGKLMITRYWRPEFHPDETKTLENWAEEIHNTLTEIVIELKADKKETAFLSSGVDSSYILAMTNIESAICCGYDNPQFDESPLAEETAVYLKRNFSKNTVQPEEYFDIVPYVMYHMEQPLGDASAIVFALGCQAAVKEADICYSGEGADEFFGGYNIYQNAEKYGDKLKEFYIGNTNIMKEEEKKSILKKYNPEVLPIHLAKSIYEENEGLDSLSKMSDVDIQIWLEGDIYLNTNKMSTACGLEIRMPLTDVRIFDIASRMPSRFKIESGQNKRAFRTAAVKVLPEAIAYRKKQGFIVPIRHWLADSRYNASVHAMFEGETAAKFFHIDAINRIFAEYESGKSDLWRQVWMIYTFLVWYDEYFIKR